MATKLIKAVSDKLLLGTCIPCMHESAAKVRVSILELDEYLLAHFKKDTIYYAYDPLKKCKAGDIVLMKKYDRRKSTIITHEVLKIVYPMGDITDPITGKKCTGRFFRDELERNAQLYGIKETSFKYDEAASRGWQEGKKDFSDKDVYVKYHQFEEQDEEYNDPYSV